MSTTRVLAFSSSRTGNSGYLETAAPIIKDFLGSRALNIAFIPFASVDNRYEEYAEMVRKGLSELPHTINVAVPNNAKAMIADSDAIMVGGGNTFKLLHDFYRFDLLGLVRNKVNAGTPYIGWSAGSNITGLTIGTTNDMPIIEPKSFKALGLLPFQINPHYINQKLEGHNGETRDQRLEEFIKLNQQVKIVCLPERTALKLEDGRLKFLGQAAGVVFSSAESAESVARQEITEATDLSYLL